MWRIKEKLPTEMEKFWDRLMPGEPCHCCGNKSIDVAMKGCFNYFDTTACIRSSVLSFLGFLTLFLCLVRIMRLHALHHPQVHQYLVFYLSSLEVVCLIIKWIAMDGMYEFIAFYLKLGQFVFLCHFHWDLVSRILHRKKLINCIMTPLLTGFFGFFSLITVLAMVSNYSPWVECLAPHWVLLSIGEFLGIQLYVVAGIYITKKINSISALDSFKKEQKRDLWSVILTYEFSSIASLAYYATLQALGSFESGCSAIFAHTQGIYSPIYTIFMIFKYLVPIWVMLLVFYPTRGCLSSEDERILGWSGDGSTTSVFSPDTRHMEQYKQLTLPVENGMGNEYPTMRRSASSPAFFSKPHLTPICEEDSMLSPSHNSSHCYGTMDSFCPHPHLTGDRYQNFPGTAVKQSSKTRLRHDSGKPSKKGRGRKTRIHGSLNHCSDEIESLTASSTERA